MSCNLMDPLFIFVTSAVLCRLGCLVVLMGIMPFPLSCRVIDQSCSSRCKVLVGILCDSTSGTSPSTSSSESLSSIAGQATFCQYGFSHDDSYDVVELGGRTRWSDCSRTSRRRCCIACATSYCICGMPHRPSQFPLQKRVHHSGAELLRSSSSRSRRRICASPSGSHSSTD